MRRPGVTLQERTRSGSGGFTFGEVLLVLVIVAILAAIALPRFGDSGERGYVASMRMDLDALDSAQESYRVANGVGFAGSVEDLGELFAASPGVTVTILSANATSWTAQASHDGSEQICAMSSEDGLAVCGVLEEGGD